MTRKSATANKCRPSTWCRCDQLWPWRRRSRTSQSRKSQIASLRRSWRRCPRSKSLCRSTKRSRQGKRSRCDRPWSSTSGCRRSREDRSGFASMRRPPNPHCRTRTPPSSLPTQTCRPRRRCTCGPPWLLPGTSRRCRQGRTCSAACSHRAAPSRAKRAWFLARRCRGRTARSSGRPPLWWQLHNTFPAGTSSNLLCRPWPERCRRWTRRPSQQKSPSCTWCRRGLTYLCTARSRTFPYRTLPTASDSPRRGSTAQPMAHRSGSRCPTRRGSTRGRRSLLPAVRRRYQESTDPSAGSRRSWREVCPWLRACSTQSSSQPGKRCTLCRWSVAPRPNRTCRSGRTSSAAGTTRAEAW